MPGREHRKPERPEACAQRRRQPRMTPQHRWQALLLDHRERLTQSEDQRNRRCEGCFVFVQGGLGAAEIEEEARDAVCSVGAARRLLAYRYDDKAGRGTSAISAKP